MFSEIRAVFSRRYLLQNTAMEVFMANRSKWKCQLLHLKFMLLLFFITKWYRSLFHSFSHVQLSWPGHGKESGLQSSSSGSGHQLWTSTSQVGHTCQKEMNPTLLNISYIVIPSWPMLTPLCCVLGPLCSLACSRVIWSPVAPVIEVDVHWPWLNWPNSLTEDSI